MSENGPSPEPKPRRSDTISPTEPNSDESAAATAAFRADSAVTPAGTDSRDAEMTGPYTQSVTSNENDLMPTQPGQRYQALRLYRQGGLGSVWLARDTLLGRDVALKTIRSDRPATGEMAARFVAEARVTGRLEHPSIVPLYDLVPAGDSATGAAVHAGPRYVMRFVTGRTLSEAAADYARKRHEGEATRMDLAGLLDAFINVCRAVAYAHSRGVIHRDLKGLNVILGGYGEVFLLDWGLAKTSADIDPVPDATGSAADETGAFAETGAGARVGTPAFMAPEVAAGQPATRASDVYGLGAILYEVLTGRPPCAGKNAAEILERLAAADPTPIREVNPSAPPALEAVCRQAMARDPARRYASADELATDVRRWLADEPVTAYREPFPARAARWARRHRTPVIAAAVLLITTAIASSAAVGLVWREQQQTKLAWKQAEANEIKATENAEAAITVVRNQSDYVYFLGITGSPSENDRKRKESLQALLPNYERLLALHPEDVRIRSSVARLYRTKANHSRLLNDMPDAERSYRAASDYYGELMQRQPNASEYREEAALTSRDFSQFLQVLGRLKDASTILDDSIRVYEGLHQVNLENVAYQRVLANMLIDRSDLDYQLGRFKDSEMAARRSEELYARLAEVKSALLEQLDPMFHAMAGIRLAVALREQERLAEAIAVHDAVVERLAALTKVSNSRDMHFQFHRALVERGVTLGQLPDRRAAAVADFDRAILGCEALAKQFPLIPIYPRVAGVGYLHRGRMRALLDQHDAAVADLNRAAKLFEGLVEKSPEIPLYRHHLGQTYLALGRAAASPSEANAQWHKSREMLVGAVKRNPENFQFRQALSELDAVSKEKP
jgi:serine/threonine-protein kinase